MKKYYLFKLGGYYVVKWSLKPLKLLTSTVTRKVGRKTYKIQQKTFVGGYFVGARPYSNNYRFFPRGLRDDALYVVSREFAMKVLKDAKL